ncbi:mCG145151, partial [Mus musculus]
GTSSQAWWIFVPLIPMLRRQRQADLYEFQPAWSAYTFLGQAGLHGKPLSQNKNNDKGETRERNIQSLGILALRSKRTEFVTV